MKKQIVYIISFLALICFVVSCKSTKKVSRSDSSISNLMDDKGLNLVDFETFSANVNGVYHSDGSGQSFNGQIRILKDSIVWVSITKFGMELARLKVTTDSFYLINRLERTLLMRPVSYLKNLLGVAIDFQTFQDVLLGNSINKESIQARVFEESDEANTSKRLTLNHLSNTLIFEYAQFEYKAESQRYAADIQVFIEGEINMGLHLQYQKITFDQPINTSFSISESLKKI